MYCVFQNKKSEEKVLPEERAARIVAQMEKDIKKEEENKALIKRGAILNDNHLKLIANVSSPRINQT
jgi:hypothetical protein